MCFIELFELFLRFFADWPKTPSQKRGSYTLLIKITKPCLVTIYICYEFKIDRWKLGIKKCKIYILQVWSTYIYIQQKKTRKWFVGKSYKTFKHFHSLAFYHSILFHYEFSDKCLQKLLFLQIIHCKMKYIIFYKVWKNYIWKIIRLRL